MILLDTDHLTPLKYRTGDRAIRLMARLDAARAEGRHVGTSIISVEEQMKGWLASIAKERQPHRQVGPYRELAALFDFFAGFALFPFTDAAADILVTLGGVHISMSDRKIAAVTLAHGALLLTANKRHFGRVPGLRFENWLDP